MKKAQKLLMNSFHTMLVLCFLLLFYLSLGYINPGPRVESVKMIRSATMQLGDEAPVEVNLPLSLRELPPRTPITLRMQICPDPDEEILVQSRFCPGKVFLGDRLGYEFGRKGQYPSFMLDPATEVHMIQLHGSGEPMELRMEFLSPKTRQRTILEAPLLGPTKEIIMERFQTFGVPCILAAAQVIYGISLLLISVFTQILDKKGVSFLWLGMLSLTTGIWALGENRFTEVICKNTALMYMCSFGGFFSFPVPLLRFTRSVVDYENPAPVWYLELFMAASAAIAMVLQLLGILAFTSSMQFFYVAIPLCLLALFLYTLREYFICKSTSAGRFLLPVSILTLTALIGLACHLFSYTYNIAYMAQLGMITFLLIMGVTTAISLKDSIYLSNRQKKMNFEKQLMEIQAREQKHHSDLLNAQEQLLSQQRHDMRHHLNVLTSLAGEDNPELRRYLDTLIQAIPTAEKKYCENSAVNAILSHYVSLCREKGISLQLELTVPQENPHISDSSLCVIFGNLLENAVEACDRMTEGDKFICLRSRIQYELLAVTMDNSFNGVIRKEGDRFRSSKRNELGVGLSSVCSAARKAGGSAAFRNDQKVFYSSVYLNL